MNLLFRQAKKADIPAIAQLLTEATAYKVNHDDTAWGTEAYTDEETAIRVNTGNTYVVLANNQIVGTLMLLWEDPRMWGEQPPNAGYIHGLAIKDEFHGQGLGSKILDWAANEVAKKGRNYLRLDCPATNKSLCAYYENHGLTRVATKSNLMIDDYTAAFYERSA